MQYHGAGRHHDQWPHAPTCGANGTMTGQRQIDEVLLPHVRLFRGAVGDKFVFMDDNATCHRTLAVQDCLDSEGSNYLGEIENDTWDIDSFFEVSPERNEINQNTENKVLYNFDINNGPGAIENDNSIPVRTTSSPRTGRIQIPVLELNDVQNQIPVRRSERLKSKLMSVHLVNNVPNSYFEAENSANWKNWKLAMENELDSLDKHKVWEIVQKPAKSKLIKTKWIYSLKQDDAGKNI
ncbi:retrovirus-related Pol polyprotein from transposon TNT 1-94 [Trichonephila clavipes]|nr:retrovirus-related Pol polyprotein from transposon TNT 1-94 [Trichonephila clavipes]